MRSANEFKKIEKEIYEDSVAYLKEKTTYKKIIAFIYDASSSAQEHAVAIDALLGVVGSADVVIASRPASFRHRDTEAAPSSTDPAGSRWPASRVMTQETLTCGDAQDAGSGKPGC